MENILVNPAKYIATTAAILSAAYALHSLSNYFAGGVCKDVIDLREKVIIITGANSGK